MAFHEEIKRYREEILEISQEEAVRRLHMSQPALSQYENGNRKITVDALPVFQNAYRIPPDYLLKMILGEESNKDYSPMILREHSKDAELDRVLALLEKHESILKFLVSLSFAPEKAQKDVAEFLPHILKIIQK